MAWRNGGDRLNICSANDSVMTVAVDATRGTFHRVWFGCRIFPQALGTSSLGPSAFRESSIFQGQYVVSSHPRGLDSPPERAAQWHGKK